MARRSLGGNYRKLFAATTISNLGDGVSLIAYPWLATAVTRNPLLIALVAVVQRLPWLLFTLPAGVITDRNDRRRLMIGANTIRFVLTALVALAVLARAARSRRPTRSTRWSAPQWFLYLVLLVATLLLGTCEVLHDNSAQTFLPAVVDDADLEQANGQMYSAEIVANQFVGPPLASLLLATGFVLPILFDAGSFAAAAGLVFTIVATRRAEPAPARAARPAFKEELAEGFRWLWHHPLLRTFAITLGFLNMLGQVYFAHDRAVRPGGAEHLGLPVRPDDDAVRRRRRPRRVVRVAHRQAHRRRRLGAAHAVVGRRRACCSPASCRSGRSSPCCSGSPCSPGSCGT